MIIQNGIEIKWETATEYISLDIPNLGPDTEIKQTTELWRRCRQFVTYQTTSSIRNVGEKCFELTIRYSHEKNPHIPFEDACWGTSTICLDTTKKEGVAKWVDDNDSTMDGTSPFKIVSREGRKRTQYKSAKQAERNQEMFKRALLSLDRRCVISGEEQVEVLEAAHIIPSCEDGPEFISNGIILRADLHKLFDKNLFHISPDGAVHLDSKISPSYRQLLSGGKIPERTAARIKDFLQMRRSSEKWK